MRKDTQDLPEQNWQQRREAMLQDLLRHGIREQNILKAMAEVPRHLFIPEALRGLDAYGDHPCPIGHGQTISQPFIVAHMTRLLDVEPCHRVLEVGTGSGYQTAVLAKLAAHVYTTERIRALLEHAERVLKELEIDNVSSRLADGQEGWEEEAPFDRIIVTCAPAKLPRRLAEQLPDGGRLVVPAGESVQRLFIVTRKGDHLQQKGDEYVRFVPMLAGTE